MFAVIEQGGKQFKVEVGQKLKIEKIKAEIGADVVLGRVLLAQIGSDTAKIGTPAIDGAKVTAKVLAHGKGKKVLAQKHRRRKQYRRIHGHRQQYTEVTILAIEA